MAVTVGPKLGKLINANINEPYFDQFRPLLRAFDQLVLGSVLDNTLTAPPSLPANGDAYIVATGGSGLWASQDHKVAVWSIEITTGGTNSKIPGWEFYTPNEGWAFWVVSLAKQMRYTGGAWTLSGSIATPIDEETPSGATDGTNIVFSLVHAPNPPTSLKLLNGGMRMRKNRGGGDTGYDYTLAGSTITYVIAPVEAQLADYTI